jgi:hypothetical protein
LEDFDAEFLNSEEGWVPELDIHSYDGTRTLTISGEAIQVTSTTISLSVTYEQAQTVLKLADPGSWDLYATKLDTTTNIVSGNLVVDLTL